MSEFRFKVSTKAGLYLTTVSAKGSNEITARVNALTVLSTAHKYKLLHRFVLTRVNAD